jgi:signal peptidase I
MSLLFRTKRKEKKWYDTTWDYVESLGIALIMALMIKASVVEAYKIPSGSMENTLLVGDFLLANKFVYGMKLPIPYTDIRLPAIDEPKPGDIVIFKYPYDNRGNYLTNSDDMKFNYIKRCIAIEGQTVEIRNKQVYVDGQLIPMPPNGKHEDRQTYPYYESDSLRGGRRDNMKARKVPPGYLFMMGDNRDNSFDSRFWGFLDRRLVLGRALMIHWSIAPERNTVQIKASDPFSLVKYLSKSIISIPSRIRYNRLGNIIC